MFFCSNIVWLSSSKVNNSWVHNFDLITLVWNCRWSIKLIWKKKSLCKYLVLTKRSLCVYSNFCFCAVRSGQDQHCTCASWALDKSCIGLMLSGTDMNFTLTSCGFQLTREHLDLSSYIFSALRTINWYIINIDNLIKSILGSLFQTIDFFKLKVIQSTSPHKSNFGSSLNVSDLKWVIPIRVFLGWCVICETKQVIHIESFHFWVPLVVYLLIYWVFCGCFPHFLQELPQGGQWTLPGVHGAMPSYTTGCRRVQGDERCWAKQGWQCPWAACVWPHTGLWGSTMDVPWEAEFSQGHCGCISPLCY